MDIDMMTEIMIGSLSTQDSKNMHSSNDSNFNLMNLNFANSHVIPSTIQNLLLYECWKWPIPKTISRPTTCSKFPWPKSKFK